MVELSGRAERGSTDGLSRAAFLRRGALTGVSLAFGSTLLEACGGSDGDVSGATSAKLTGKTQLLRFDDGTKGAKQAYAATAAAFEKAHSGVTTEAANVPFADYLTAATTRCRARKVPGALILLPGSQHSQLYPCVERLSDGDIGDLRDQLSGWDLAKDDSGAYIGFPTGAQSLVWYYSKELFEKAGLDPEAPPTTFDEFATACDALKAKGIQPIAVSGGDSWTPWWMWAAFMMQFFPTEEDTLAFKDGEIPITDARGLRPLEVLQETYDRGWWADGFKGKQITDAEADFANGDAAIVCGLVTQLANWHAWDERLGQDAYGVFATPSVEGAPTDESVLFYQCSVLWCESAAPSNRELALAYAKFGASKEAQTLQLRFAGTFPNRTDIDVGEESGSQGAAAVQKLMEAHPRVTSVTTYFTTAAVTEALTKLTSSVTSGDLKGFLERVQAQQSQRA